MVKDHSIKTSLFSTVSHVCRAPPPPPPSIICYTFGALKDFNAAGFKV